MAKPDIHRLLKLQSLLLEFSQIERWLHRKHNNAMIRENDTEHSYNLALTGWYLSAYFPELDRDRVIRYALVHDIVEVHAGDTYVYADAAVKATKKTREAAALTKLIAEWPDFSDLTDQITEYEARKSSEAKFVYALDKLMPVMLIYLHEGYTWQKQHITLEKLQAVKRQVVQSHPEVEKYYDDLEVLLMQNRHMFASTS